ncbi:MAG: MaoC/PaaZ C-terminal domain-containing protein, partial [Desulfobacterales bacterium]
HMNLLRVVHAQQTIRWHRILASGKPLRLQVILAGVRDTRAGELVEISSRCEADGENAVEGVTGLLVRSKKRRSPGERLPSPPALERLRVDIPTRDGQQFDYAKVSGDWNFIHTSELLARAAGLPRTILHGACVLAMTCRALTEALTDGDVGRICEIGCRFARPVIPGTPLTLVGYQSADRRKVPFEVIDESGNPVIKNGHFSYDASFDGFVST